MSLRSWLLIVSLMAPALGAADACEDLDDVEARMSCLEEQYCADSKSDAERARCYREMVRTLLSETTPQEQAQEEAIDDSAEETPAASPVQEQAEAPSEEKTGASEKIADEDAFGRRPEPVYEGEEPKRVDAAIAKVVEQRDGRLLIALDNGQVWEENEPSRRRRAIRIGSTAEVSKVTFSYIMRFEGGGSTHVTRLACDSPHARTEELRKCRRAGFGEDS